MEGRHHQIDMITNLNMERYIYKNYYVRIPFYFSFINHMVDYSHFDKKKLKDKQPIKLLTNGN